MFDLDLWDIRKIAEDDRSFSGYLEETLRVPAEDYFRGDKMAVDVFNAKYALDIEGRKETPGEVFWRVSSELADIEREETDDEKAELYRRLWYMHMFEGWYRPGGSILSGVRSDRKKISLFNCCTLPLREDSLEGIFDCFYWMAKCAAYRQGLGVDFSRLRPKGSPIGNSAEVSSGVVSWAEFLQLVGDYVGQLGRRPAILESLRVSHPDIFDFIRCKDDLSRMNNVNISVQVTDDFMQAVMDDGTYTLEFYVPEHDWHVKKVVRARDLFREIAEHAWRTGEPGVQYIDLMKRGSIQEALSKALDEPRYEIISTNACSEKPLPAFSVCDLLSINARKFSKDPGLYGKELREIADAVVRFLDNVISYELKHNLSPLPQQRNIVTELREIGCGITNLHGRFLDMCVDYDSEEAIAEADRFMSLYAKEVFEASLRLGKEKGMAPAISRLVLKYGEREGWEKLKSSELIRNILERFYPDGKYPELTLRNCALMSVAPTGSISITFPGGCLSSGVEPLMGWYYWRKTRAVEKGSYIYYFIIPREVKDFVLSMIPKDTEDYRKLSEFPGSVRDDDGSIGKEYVAIMERYLPKDTMKPAHQVDPIKKVRLMATLYKWVDAAISCTFNMTEDAPVELVEEIYRQAWLSGVRAVTVYRDGSRDGVFIFDPPQEYEARLMRKIHDPCLKRPEDILYHCAPKRPRDLPCDIHHCTIRGKKWLVLVGLYKGSPYEVFAGEYDPEVMRVPRSQTTGVIRKLGSGKYALITKIRGQEVVYDDIAGLLMNEDYRALTRLISTALRHGTYPEFVVQQLKKSGEGFSDFSTVVARVLSKYVSHPHLIVKERRCPNCGGEGTLSWQEGCLKCLNCGYSKCG